MRFQPLRRRIRRFVEGPVSVWRAMVVIVWAIGATVLVGGLVATIFDPHDFPTLGAGLWWALQTVTTVGYGDVVPTTTLGRVVGAVIMLESIAFVSILTAVITSTFIEQARGERTPPPARPKAEPTNFGTVMTVLLGGFEMLVGIVALFNPAYFSSRLPVPIGFTAWGWIHVLIGLALLTAGVRGVNRAAVALAAVCAVANLAFLPAYPLWGVVMLVTSVIVINALA